MSTKNSLRSGRQQAQGSQPSKTRERGENDWRAPFDCPPHILAFLRNVYKHRSILTDRETSIVRGCLTTAKTKMPSEAQMKAALEIGRRVGVGCDEPAVGPELAKTFAVSSFVSAGARVLKVETWGALPAKPPKIRA